MIEIAVKFLEGVTGAEPFTGNADRICKGCVIDSRLVQKDSIFVAFPGERVDGNDYVESAIDAGAACVVVTKKPSHALIKYADDAECAVFYTADPELFLQRLAQGYRARLKCTVIGVTGSVGKTSTKDLLGAMLAKRYRVHTTEGNYNNLLGLPLTILSAPKNTQVMVLEMGMSELGEISTLTRIAQPTYSIITKIGTSHIGCLGSQKNIARAKAEIIEGMPASQDNFEGHHSALFLNGEDEFTPFIASEFAAPAGVDVVLCGTSSDDDVSAFNIELDDNGHPHFDIEFEDACRFKTSLGLTGKHSVTNALLAAGVARRMGVPAFEIHEAAQSVVATSQRQEQKMSLQGARIIDDSYNASPDSMAAGLDVLEKLDCVGDKIAVLGEIGELGDEALRLHELIGSYVAAKHLDMVMFVGNENARAMASAARLMGMDESAITVVKDADKALRRLKPALNMGDLVLIKGSHFVGLDRVVKGLCE